jgi:hypothetical protein
MTGLPDELLLYRRHTLEWNLHAQVAPCYHDAVKSVNDRLCSADGFRSFHLRKDRPFVAEATRDLPKFIRRFGAANERESQPIRLSFHRNFDGEFIAFRDGCDCQRGIGEVDPFVRLQDSTDENLRKQSPAFGLHGFELQPAIIEQNPVAGANIRETLGFSDDNVIGMNRLFCQGKRQLATTHEGAFSGNFAPQLRAGQVRENRRDFADPAGSISEARCSQKVLLSRTVRKVNTGDIHAGPQHGFEHGRVVRGWPERGYDLGSTHGVELVMSVGERCLWFTKSSRDGMAELGGVSETGAVGAVTPGSSCLSGPKDERDDRRKAVGRPSGCRRFPSR